jgi:hypothetical protein
MLGYRTPLRLFLDAGVIIDGCFNPWGTCKSVLILATLLSIFVSSSPSRSARKWSAR